jgi:hypothetical protein
MSFADGGQGEFGRSLAQLQHIAARATNRLNRLVLLILWWEGRGADPGEKRGPRKTERYGRKKNSKCLTSTRRIEKAAETKDHFPIIPFITLASDLLSGCAVTLRLPA